MRGTSHLDHIYLFLWVSSPFSLISFLGEMQGSALQPGAPSVRPAGIALCCFLPLCWAGAGRTAALSASLFLLGTGGGDFQGCPQATASPSIPSGTLKKGTVEQQPHNPVLDSGECTTATHTLSIHSVHFSHSLHAQSLPWAVRDHPSGMSAVLLLTMGLLNTAAAMGQSWDQDGQGICVPIPAASRWPSHCCAPGEVTVHL